MRIGLSCTAEGFGHASRLVALAQEMRGRHDIVCFAPRRLQGFFAEYLPGVQFHEIPYFKFILDGDRVRYMRTFLANLPVVLGLPFEIRRLRALLKDLKVDGVVSDYDPFVGIAAGTMGIPVIGLNHPGVVLRQPHLDPEALLAKLVAALLMTGTSKELICSFYDGDVGPIIRNQVRELDPHTGDRYLVYLKGKHRDLVADKLAESGVTNVDFFPSSELNYLRAFATCRGVITAAGHQILSEAIYLGKPVFALPQQGQFEQRLNGMMLEASGWGVSSTVAQLSSALPRFLREVDAGGFPKPTMSTVRFEFRDQTRIAAAMIEQMIGGARTAAGDLAA